MWKVYALSAPVFYYVCDFNFAENVLLGAEIGGVAALLASFIVSIFSG
jgi:hypothetical protein